jgi:histidinol-phosphate aminotransferase
MRKASIDSYPDSNATELKQALAAKLKISPDNLIIGSGSTELIRLIALAYFSPEDLILIPKPTYGEYEIACQLVGTRILHQSALANVDFQVNVKDTIDLVHEHSPRGIFWCNPNNPTGQYLAKQEIEQVISNARESLVILDEAYIAFTENAWSSLDLLKHDNLIILRSMTKDYALAGLRLGYAIATEPIISILNRVRPPWNVNAIAQKAGIFALKTDSYIEECGIKIQEGKNLLIKELSQLGLEVVPSQTNFFLVKVRLAFEFRQALLQLGFLVRDCTSFGLPSYIRLAPRTLPECHKLIEAIKEFLNSYAS